MPAEGAVPIRIPPSEIETASNTEDFGVTRNCFRMETAMR